MAKGRFGERLRSRAAEKKLNQAALHRLTGLSRQALSDYFAGRKVAGSENLFALADALEVDPRWLILGSGQVAAVDRRRNEALPSAEEVVAQLGLTMIPEADVSYALGAGSVIDEFAETRMVPFRSDWVSRLTRGRPADVFLARGQGDSMMPSILNDDEVLINRADRTIRQQDQIWAVGYGELGMIKRVRRLPTGMFQLNSDNAAVSPIEATDDELYIVGRVIWIGRRV